ncbi:30S ribosomal protein S8 [bacterium]|nr:30S ribosomal protein S8 [bacterium]
MITDPIADLITRIRNAQNAKHKSVSVPASKLKKQVLDVLKKEGFISRWNSSNDSAFEALDVELRYERTGRGVIRKIDRISKPGRRVYFSSEDLKKGSDIITLRILTTSNGVMSDKEAISKGIGGEVICEVS